MKAIFNSPACSIAASLLLILIAVCKAEVQNVTVDYAFSSGRTQLTLVSGVTALDMAMARNVEFGTYSIRSLFPKEAHHAQAAVRVGINENIIFYGAKSGLMLMVRRDGYKKVLKYGRVRKFIRNGGPDAAGRKGDKVYVFKGCEMAVRHKWNNWSKPANVESVGLPCHMDAAWKHGDDEMRVLRGNQVWTWKADDSVEGPVAIKSLYNIESWNLNPYTEK